MKYVYGPVPSRRLGKSLGVNLTPFKTCSYSCIYCQLGRTTFKTVERKSFFKKEEILEEISKSLKSNPDYVTFAGEGEPTLNSDLGWILERINHDTAVITNSSLLWRKDVREDLMQADACLPSIDAVTEKTFKRINRPHPSLEIEKVLDGLKEFCDEFDGTIMLEIMIVKGYNDEEVEKIAEVVGEIKKDKVHILTPIRPPASKIEGVDARKMIEILSIFDAYKIPVEIVDFLESNDFDFSSFSSLKDAIKIMRRHPMREEQVKKLAEHFEVSLKEIEEINGIFYKKFKGKKYYYYL